MDEMKIFNKCEKVSPKTSFYKNKNFKEGYLNECKKCSKYYTRRNQEKINIYKKQCFQQNKEKINEYKKQYVRNRIETDVNYRLIVYTRKRIYKSLKRIMKQSSSRDELGIDIENYRKWIERQMTPEMNWSNIEIDHVRPICMFYISKGEELKKAFSWKNTQPLIKHNHHLKGALFNFQDYQFQWIKAYQFIKLNDQEGLN